MTNAEAKILLDACVKELTLWANAVAEGEPGEVVNCDHEDLLGVATELLGDGGPDGEWENSEVNAAFRKLLRAVAYSRVKDI